MRSLSPYSHTYCHTYYYWYSITHSLFHSRLKSFLFCKTPPYPFLFLIQVSLYGFPRLFTLLLSISVFLLFSFFFDFYTFLVVGSVRSIKLTYVGFRAHVKIASRIVSYRTRKVNQSGFKWGKRWWDFGMQWHKLDHMQTIYTLLQTYNHASTPTLSF